MVNYCCEMMKKNIYENRENKIYTGDKEDKVIYYNSQFDEYGIPIYDNLQFDEHGKSISKSNSCIIIHFCPWCGNNLPESKRDLFFSIIEKLGCNYIYDHDCIPKKYKKFGWWNNIK